MAAMDVVHHHPEREGHNRRFQVETTKGPICSPE